jgi:hypothetical protein
MDKNKTYAEAQGKTPFDWNEFLDRAIMGEISKDEYNNARYLSDNWVTCACGNQCDIIPRDRFSRPKDPNLKKLGIIFNYEIICESYGAAKETLSLIEARSAKLIAEIEKEASHE